MLFLSFGVLTFIVQHILVKYILDTVRYSTSNLIHSCFEVLTVLVLSEINVSFLIVSVMIIIIVRMRLKKTLRMEKFLMKMILKWSNRLNKVRSLKYLKINMSKKVQREKILIRNGKW